ncbi:heavy metal sensor histidine kinase [Paraburkholderia diazotrophica]|uniref:Sensor protein n=1 Tax=Paraburkholderia diazotrophica TaxID=667676 RepID=A0A1H7C523_9BURK|nr:heavy metal sensor histidine kinase [Paraburkholderia diazotrophica]SEJ84394.1 heavy metal sensor signal transduction histidine kinase [Paraburkholderia diazotrophica]
MTARKAPYSLLRRLTGAFALAALVVFALIGAFLYRSLSRELQRRDDIEITGKLAQFQQLVRDAGSLGAVQANPAMFHKVLLSHPGVYLGIFDQHNRVLVEHADQKNVDLVSVVRDDHPVGTPYTCDIASTGPSRCIFAEESLPSHEVVRVVVARAASDRQSLLESYRVDIWVAVAFGAALVGTLGYAVARQGLLPVRSIGRQTSRIEAHNLSERLDIKGGPVELQEIALSVNRMLDRLERAFVRLSQFSSDLAHDMRTPLANVISASQVTLSRTRTTEEYEALIDSNIEECERLHRMIENMLFLARTDNAQQVLHVSELDAKDELGRLASYFQGLAEEADIHLTVEGNARVAADATLFRRAVSNLISNALEHAFHGSSVELSASESAKYTVIEVTNQGHSIAPEHVDKIFERFYRVDASRHGSAKNTGLGLAIVKSIMELHRGKVDVASYGERTTFTLYFPRATGT